MTFTLILAFINSKYKSDYQMLFVGTFLLDMAIIQGVVTVVRLFSSGGWR